MNLPPVVSETEWQAARETLLAEEKEATRARDALAAKRRRLPMFRIDKSYVFDGPDGTAGLPDLFEGRRQLLLYHFMFGPNQDAGCDGCSMFVDQIGHLAHIHARDTSFALVSRAPITKIEAYRKRMGWTVPVLVVRERLQHRFRRRAGIAGSGRSPGRRDVRPQCLPARGQGRLPHVLHHGPRRRGPRERLDLPRPDTARPAGRVGRLTSRVPSDEAV
jgi:Bacterial protein of unknown function (DUF899)